MFAESHNACDPESLHAFSTEEPTFQTKVIAGPSFASQKRQDGGNCENGNIRDGEQRPLYVF